LDRKYLFSLGLLFLVSSFFIFNKKADTIYSNIGSGFYLKPFELVLTSERENTIRYTFNGSDPTNTSEIFHNQLLITGMESSDSLSFINTTNNLSKYEKWVEPVGVQNKATIVKYASFKGDSILTDVKTLSFFVKNDALDGKHQYNLPVISISTDKKNLYSMDQGIFIAGDSLIKDQKHTGNFFQRGKEFEREVYFQYFNSKGELDFELNIGMRIHGGVTRRFPQKSLKFYKRKSYDKVKVNFPFLAKKGVKRFIAEGMQESGGGRALIEDIVAQEIVKGIGLEQQNFQAVIVFINGEYWGLHTIRDRIDEKYLAYKFDLHRDSFDIIDGHARKGYNPIYGDSSGYLFLLDFIKKNDLSKNKNYEFVSSKLDVDNFIDYYSVEIFFANRDWPVQNIKMWKKKSGKWRFLLYDLDGGFSHKSKKDIEEDHLFDMFTYLLNKEDCSGCLNPPISTLLFRGLSANLSFKKKFENRYKEIVNLYMDTLETIPIVDSIAKIYAPYMQEHIQRWGFPTSVKNQWERDINTHIKKFLLNREEHTLRNLNNYIKRKESND
jgi:hypothetical protein|tara:strand:+ start:206 stop:1861 length:1656 start_codon:yes stop_codon:yes gene_type:complete